MQRGAQRPTHRQAAGPVLPFDSLTEMVATLGAEGAVRALVRNSQASRWFSVCETKGCAERVEERCATD